MSFDSGLQERPGKVGILFSDFGPYHVARIDALAELLHKNGRALIAFRFSERSTTYGWEPARPQRADVVTLGEGKGSLQLAAAFFWALRGQRVTAVFLPSYSPLPNLLCFLAARLAMCQTILMSESWSGTEKARNVKRIIKRLLIGIFDAALVGGSRQCDYISSYGMPRNRIFTGYDVVDNNHFRQAAVEWKSWLKPLPYPNLPPRFFLNLGRFVEKKNLECLIKAYSKLITRNLDASIALVLVGSGEMEGTLREVSEQLELEVVDGIHSTLSGKQGVMFFPFQQLSGASMFYALCEAFILPSTSEEWGLVVNEAMACGTPVIVSVSVGCAADLVEDGVNGFIFDPLDADDLALKLEAFLQNPELRGRMGAAGARKIEGWDPMQFAEGAVGALAVGRR